MKHQSLSSLHCPLCNSSEVNSFWEDNYFRCSKCDLIFVPLQMQISFSEKNRRYEKHQNNPQDINYRNFLMRLIRPLLNHLHGGESGLDFGCGPGPTLSTIFAELNFSMKNYDPLFFDDKNLLLEKYDFITCTEVIEHFEEPAKSWEMLISLLRPLGTLGVMTDIYNNEKIDFKTWYYKNDPTHVLFYSQQTFAWIAKRWGLKINYTDARVVIFSLL